MVHCPRLELWHNPRCSKSREALARLADRGVTAAIIDYLRDPPSAARIEALLRKLVRFKDAEAAGLGLSPTDERPVAEWARVLAANPRLIERPVLEADDRAVIGRPVERLDELL